MISWSDSCLREQQLNFQHLNNLSLGIMRYPERYLYHIQLLVVLFNDDYKYCFDKNGKCFAERMEPLRPNVMANANNKYM